MFWLVADNYDSGQWIFTRYRDDSAVFYSPHFDVDTYIRDHGYWFNTFRYNALPSHGLAVVLMYEPRFRISLMGK